ncbi:glycoside hydrolase family 88 protein [Paenibacillus sp. P96]|uniref:Glycoside hydrolase family 88 protein n=1 Tax=Paenibacillus zeirhizosphaerae TaxID=2987519 RepID=A0ABT9FUV0_9BACL|nr:glycoside hydrolase family 88 protein [Paenibacillus sp. P96]MDP4098507.1 glycoside hydrolase family 88 protein [Paenibacillus sp. P96]
MLREGYIAPEMSIACQGGDEFAHTLLTIAGRYTGANPPHPPVYRVTRLSPIRKAEDHRYTFPLDTLFPGMKAGQKVYAWGKVWSESEHDFLFQITCHGPVRLYHNGRFMYGSSPDEEFLPAPMLRLRLHLTAGWNYVVLEFRKGEKGCGGLFGTSSRKNQPLHFVVPSSERDGEEGWLYTEPLDEEPPFIPAGPAAEGMIGVKWLPEREEDEGISGATGQLLSIYGQQEQGTAAYAWTKVDRRLHEWQAPFVLEGEAYSPVRLIVNDKEVYRQDAPGPLRVELNDMPPRFDLTVRCECGESGWGFRLEEAVVKLLSAPVEVKGYRGAWLYLGPFGIGQQVDLSLYRSMTRTARSLTGEEVYWRTGQRGGEVRPFLENEWFGRWNYPLGVTLYGLLQLARTLKRSDLLEYVVEHVKFAASRFEYSLWDRQRYGAAGLNNQLSHIDSLDDCGSFGALMLLANEERELEGVRAAAEHIADYILKQQSRLACGTLYRKIGVSRMMDNTMWCDDLYMSIPFLCRYAKWAEDASALDEAAQQVLLYKKYLYMPELQIMSHVYHVEKGQPTLTPWGRGNGWVLFSLTELLTVLPEEHASHAALMQFYKELCAGYLPLQGENGLWHQVLTDPESYEEASCTSMFIYAFARGVRLGWLATPEVYRQAALQGWAGLRARAIDKFGNVYGVCRGSSYSFSNSYYKHELTWNLNDTHGIGIVLLAGLEAWAMQQAHTK